MTIDERIAAYLDKIPPCVEGNGGDTRLYKVACALYQGFALSEQETLAWLHKFNEKCEPPWPPEEYHRLEHKAAEAVKAKYVKPRGYLLGGSAPLKLATFQPAEPIAIFQRPSLTTFTTSQTRIFLPTTITKSHPRNIQSEVVSVVKLRNSGFTDLKWTLASVGALGWLWTLKPTPKSALESHGKTLKSRDALDCHKGNIRLVNICHCNGGNLVLRDLFTRAISDVHWSLRAGELSLTMLPSSCALLGTQIGIFQESVFCTMTATKLLSSWPAVFPQAG